MNKRTLVILAVGLSQALCAHANTDKEVAQLLSLSLEDLMATRVTISTNTKQALSWAPSVVSVITTEDIKATGATNVTEILHSVPGIYIKTNLFGFKPQVTFRGAGASHTLLMVNGAPMRDLVWSSSIFWRGLPTNMIERVEVIRGPGSALFGSDASAGVINVITKAAGKIEQSEAGMRAGDFDTQAGWMQHGGTWNGFDIGFTAELSHTDGHNPFIENGTAASFAPGHARYGYDNQDIRFSMARGNWHLHADYMHHGNVKTGLSGGGLLDPRTTGSDNRLNIDLFYNNEAFARNWGLNAELRYTYLDYTSGDGFQESPPTGAYPDGKLNLQRSAERRLGFEVSGLYTGARYHAIRVGGGYVNQDLYAVEHFVNFGKGPDGTTLPDGGPLVNLSGSPYAFAPEKARQTSYLFLQDAWMLAPDWELTAGARYDHYSDFGGALNPRLALVWQGTDKLTAKLMYGQAFRAPSYLELYSLTAATSPNPNLAPERSKTWDLAVSYLASRDLKLGLNFFHFAQTNLIAGDSSNVFQNIGSNTSRGVELEAMWQATKTLRVSGNLTHRKDISTTFTSVPKQKAYLRTDWAFLPNWHWNVQANWIDRISLPLGDPRSPMGAYTLVDTTIRYSHRRNWEFAASIRNLFDVDAREYTSSKLPNNLPLAGRNVYGEIRYKF